MFYPGRQLHPGQPRPPPSRRSARATPPRPPRIRPNTGVPREHESFQQLALGHTAWHRQTCQLLPGGSCVGAGGDGLHATLDLCMLLHAGCAGFQCACDARCPGVEEPCLACPDGTFACKGGRCEAGTCGVAQAPCP